MKKKVFFILSSFRAGGAERVFWLLSQNIDKTLYDVSVVLLDSNNSFFDMDLPGVRIIDLKTIRASKSFFKLLNLFKKEQPDTVFTTGGQINILVGLISTVVNIPQLIARPTNQDNSLFMSLKGKIYGAFTNWVYSRFDKIICQSSEIKAYVMQKHKVSVEKLIIIPNPVIIPETKIRNIQPSKTKRLIIVARLTAQKGIERLLSIIQELPENYQLTIVGDGVLKSTIAEQIISMNLSDRVTMLGMINNVLEVVSQHDLFVLPSFIEGFPNVVIEALSVGTPVVSFSVGGISEILRSGFNGYILQQGDLDGFKRKVIMACEQEWQSGAIQEDIQKRFSVASITKSYEGLIR